MTPAHQVNANVLACESSLGNVRASLDNIQAYMTMNNGLELVYIRDGVEYERARIHKELSRIRRLVDELEV